MKEEIGGIVAVLIIVLVFGSYFIPVGGETGNVEIWLSLQSGETKALKSHLDEYESETGVSVSIRRVPQLSDLRKRFKVAARSGLGPDILIGPHDWIGELHSEFLTPITEDRLSQEDREKFLNIGLEACTYENEFWGVPTLAETLLFFYNKDEISNPPDNWAELKRIAEEKTNKSKQKWGFYYPHVDPYYTYPFMSGYGAYVFENENTDNIGLDTPGAAEGVSLIQDMVKGGLLPRTAYLTPYVTRDYLKSGSALMTIDGPWAFRSFEEAGINYGVDTLPELPNGKDPKPFIGVQTCMISSYSKNKEKALDVIKWINTPKAQKSLYKEGGRLPTKKSVLQDFENNVKVQTLRSEIGMGVLTPKVPETQAVWTPWKNTLKMAFANKVNKNPKPMLEDAVSSIRKSIEKTYG